MAKGRPRKQGQVREHNGRASRRAYRGETEVQATSTALNARMRLYGLQIENARLPDAGALIGRMKLVEDVSAEQHQAALEWIKVRAAYLHAIAAPEVPHEPREGVSGTLSDEDYAKSCRSRIERYESAVDALTTSPARYLSWHGEMTDALDAFLLYEEHIPRLVPALRAALDILHRHWFVARKRDRVA